LDGADLGKTAQVTFSRYLTSLIPAKVGSNIGEFVRISEAASKVELRGAASALKGPMFENYVRLYMPEFQSMGRKAYTREMIPALKLTGRSADAWVSHLGEIWEFKNVVGAVDPKQLEDYRLILQYEARSA